ncbi:unnamed protein product, partial [Ectocarpus sp. 4 AP-2014]
RRRCVRSCGFGSARTAAAAVTAAAVVRRKEVVSYALPRAATGAGCCKLGCFLGPTVYPCLRRLIPVHLLLVLHPPPPPALLWTLHICCDTRQRSVCSFSCPRA